MSSFSPVIRVRKLLDKIKSERSSPRLKRFPSRTLSDNQGSSSSYDIPPFRKTMIQYTGENQFNILPPEATLYIFSFLDSRDLCRIGQVSKDMFVFSEDEGTWRQLATYDWGIEQPFASSWKETYALLEDLSADGIWEGMSKWIEPPGHSTEQKTTARLQFVKRSHRQLITPIRSSPTVVHRVDSQVVTTPIVKSDSSSSSSSRDAPYKIVGSGVTVNCESPSPFKIEGQKTGIIDSSGCTFQWNKQFEKHTSVYNGQMDYANRSVNGTIDYNDGTTHWKGVFEYTKVKGKKSKLILA